MNVEIDDELLVLLKRRKELLGESDSYTADRGSKLWLDEYNELCVSIARCLSVRVFHRGGVL